MLFESFAWTLEAIKPMKISLRILLVGMAAMLTPALAGCFGGDGPERVSVSGRVTFQGEPVREGEIRFMPTADSSAPIVIEPFSDGRYATTISGGVPVGRFRVEIRSFDPDSPVPTGPGMPQRMQLLPEKYNKNSELEEFTVPPGSGSITKDFNLE